MRRPLLALLLLAAALGAAGCGAVGRVTSGDASSGKALFQQNCGSCHTLADAKTSGTIGPNLDDAFQSDKRQGFKLQTIKDVIRGQIAYPEEPMPPHIVQGDEADDVATYVAECSGNAQCGVRAAKPSAPATTTSGGATTAPPAGQGGASSAVSAGKQVFDSAGCSGCHTLKDAGATGTVGPNLDQLKPSKPAVQQQVINGGGAMPAFKGRLSSKQIDDVATYVSSVAGK